MCGILGLLAFEKLDPEMEAARQEAMIFLGTEVLQQTQDRGKDATGIITLHKDGIYTGQKMGIPSAEFIARFGGKKDDFEGYLKSWRKHPEPASIVLGHCRKSSVGNSWNNMNNHPIKVGEIVGVHNGTLTNHEAIFKNLAGKRDGTVDSEAIMRLVHHYSKNGKTPFTTEMIEEVCTRLVGTFACAIMSGNNPFQVVTFRDMRPMWYALIRPLKLVVIASGREYLENAFFKVNKWVKLYGNSNNWPALTKHNVDFKELQDEAIAIFNLTEEINDKTTVDDLYDFQKIPRPKLWRTAVSSNTTTHNGWPKTGAGVKQASGTKANADADAGTTKKAEVSGKPVATADDSKNNKSALLYNKELKKFVRFNNDVSDETKAKGVTEIEVLDVKNNVKDITKNTKHKGIKKQASTVEDHSKKDDSVIVELDPVEQAGSDYEDGDTAENQEAINGNTIEVDMFVDPEATEIANDKANELHKFSDDKEVMLELEIADETVLKDLQPHAFANKVRKHSYRVGVYEGIIIGKGMVKDKPSVLMLEKDANKSVAAEKYIRQLKVMTNMLSKIIGTVATSSIDSSVMEKIVVETLDMKEDVDSQTLTTIFSIGDFKKNPVARQLRDMVATKENRK